MTECNHELGSIAEDNHGNEYLACDHCEYVDQTPLRVRIREEREERKAER